MNKLLRLSGEVWMDPRTVNRISVEHFEGNDIIWVSGTTVVGKAEALDGETTEDAVTRIATAVNTKATTQ